MPKNTGRNKKVVPDEQPREVLDNFDTHAETMKTQSISAVYNKNGILTIFVLMQDGTIMFKREDEDQWHTTQLGMPL
jgi:hypothetical protein